MGTNYYVKQQKCQECGNEPTPVHIGKSSIGWSFLFNYNGGRYYKDYATLRDYLKEQVLYDEYENTVDVTGFWWMVECKKHHQKQEGVLTIDGLYFLDCEFT